MRRLFFIFIFCMLLVGLSWAEARSKAKGLTKLWVTHTADTKQALEAYHAAQPVPFGSSLVFANALDGMGMLDTHSGRLVWKFRTPGGVDTDLVRHKNSLFFGANDGVFYSLSLLTGHKQWSLRLSAPPSGVHHANGVVYIMTRKGVVYALQASTGQVRWSVSLGGAGASGALQAGDGASGAPLEALQMRLTLRPAVQGAFVLVGFADRVYALNKNTGQISWHKNLKSTSSDTLYLTGGVRGVVGAKGLVYASHFERGVFCLRLKDGQVVWRQEVGAVSSVRVKGERLFYAASAGGVVALRRATGQKVWQLDDSDYGVATEPEFLGSQLVVARAQGPVQVIDAVRGRVEREFFTGHGVWARPWLDKVAKRVYVMSSRAHLYALGL